MANNANDYIFNRPISRPDTSHLKAGDIVDFVDNQDNLRIDILVTGVGTVDGVPIFTWRPTTGASDRMGDDDSRWGLQRKIVRVQNDIVQDSKDPDVNHVGSLLAAYDIGYLMGEDRQQARETSKQFSGIERLVYETGVRDCEAGRPKRSPTTIVESINRGRGTKLIQE